ncbi:hypothetical protein EMIHUDRAFT_431981 [Emiliania huxleyi CCMP1516]|uniref:Uncharacterized protein n=2 Tax=Emiliania huxleyi TaxID=2903 RepID=A0A0D3JGP2_EMIH1|nr:hypothetical protein EMIHUDRAFT_431981 [Emiliania huxleyi CCMP1516]EOD22677.1 hypothetical protein EMIHUDRAFT_431981 [Emiliania huxleyi CCMP1516]|eukprot:XP_005775106.1 hypothetical protein EMIHUDRAFT_431981 [Emiliania huxleyi CCMP1516]
MLGTKRVVEVPFTARLKPASAAPDNCNYEVRGTFKGVEITTVRLKVEEDNDFEFDGACASFSDAASPPSPPPPPSGQGDEPKKDIPGSDTIDDNSDDDYSNSSDGIAPIVGGAVGGLVATFVLVIVLVYLLKKRAQPKVPPACPPVTVGVEVHAAAPPPAGSARLST